MKLHCLVALVLTPLLAVSVRAEDWGAYSIVPVSAQAMVLEAVGSGAVDGTAVLINKPKGTANQKWLIVPKGGGFFAIKPSHSPTLALSAARGGAKNGTALMLGNDRGEPWQLWAMTKHENGSYSLTPKHAPAMGIDDNGGKQQPGAKIDLWSYGPKDQHLQWFIKPLAGSGVEQAAVDAAAKYEPPAIKPEEILPGTTRQFRFEQSKIFPGTVRDVTVFIPAQYDGQKPACVYVKTDGFRPPEKSLLERMIATGEMPVTVGVFVRPGELRPPMKGTLGRRNRCYEYDGVSDNNVRFFTEELLPFVAKECQLNLSTDGNDRCISGGSSGGIAAFTAAWRRPEAFSRVYAASGSWVAFRGGNEFPTMVRKFEAKPIRAYLTTGTRDMENAAGDWFLLDLEMDKALKFSGYDYQFRVINGGHGAGYMENYQEAMAYLWRGWPERVKAGLSAPRAQDILIPEENWQLVADELKDARAPASNAQGEVFFIAGNQIHRLGLDGKISRFAADAKQAGGLTIGAHGHLYSVSAVTGAILDYDAAGGSDHSSEASATVVADGIRGHSILAMPDGSFYVTSDADHGSVWRIKDGQRSRVDTGLKHPTGLAYRPDQWLLAVCEGQSKWTCSYQIADSGELTNKERFFWHHVADWDDDTGAESACYSLEGRLLVATRTGIQITADDGPTQVILPLPDRSRVLGVCLGGRELDTLFAFCGDKIWKRQVRQHAMGAFTPWTKVTGNKL
ncbi:MAG TPA: RICIN domain-containing protein [Pirellulales bacterium]